MKKIYPVLFLTILTFQVKVFASQFPSRFSEQLIAQDLDPTDLVYAPDGRIFITIKSGKVLIVQNGELLSTPLLNIENKIDNYNERGLGHIVLDPAFHSNGYFYVYYTLKGANHNRVSRFRANQNTSDPSSEFVLMNLDVVSGAIHNGGDLVFGADGKLYISVGDGAKQSAVQSLNSVLGKILRINPDGSIPTDNPFYANTTGKYRSIWALGFRNPYSLDVQPGTGRIYACDVGSNKWEEVNHVEAGKDYGWPTIEGKRTNQKIPTIGMYTDPVYSYPWGEGINAGCSIIGASFYNPTTPQFPQEYIGKFFFADYCNGYIKYLDPEHPEHQPKIFAKDLKRPLAIITASDGTMYYLGRAGIGDLSPGDNTTTKDGTLWKITYSESGAPAISVAPQPVTVSVGGEATFTVTASGARPLSYQWKVNNTNIDGATDSVYKVTNVQLSDNGKKFSCAVSNSAGSITSSPAVLTVTANTKPKPIITWSLPDQNTKYKAGQTLSFNGTATDNEEGELPASSFTWKIDFHHDSHTHPAQDPVSGASSGSYLIPQVGETADNVWYRIYLTVTDNGIPPLSETVYQDIFPQKVNITLDTEPTGFDVMLDGVAVKTPYTFTGIVGITRMIEAAPVINDEKNLYLFDRWSDGNDPVLNFNTPESDKTYRVFYNSVPLGTGNGLMGHYYTNQEKTFTDPPTLIRTDASINFDWGNASPDATISADNFTVRWTGTILPQFTDTYTFYAKSDDGVRLWINDQLIIDQWTDQHQTEVSGTAQLEKEKTYPIKVEYFDKVGGASIHLYWSTTKLPKQIIPVSQLSDIITGNEKQIINQLKLFPSLASDKIHIESDTPIGEWSITDAMGKIIKKDKTTETTTTITLDSFSPGVYLFKNGNNIPLKFAIKK